MFPYRDENQTLRTPLATYALIALNVLVWIVVQGAGEGASLSRSVCQLGLIPGELTGRVPPGTQSPLGEGAACVTEAGRHVSHLLTSMFLHGSWMHLLGNMWFLWIFGDNVEDAMTRPRFIAFYLLCGIAAALTQVATGPTSGVPVVGASGAISGVMGAYLILYPRVRVYLLVPLGFLLTSIAVPAWTMLLYWVGLQVLSGFVSLGNQAGAGVAFWAHVGGSWRG
jgi:membrane associated rhomboid family serine protease